MKRIKILLLVVFSLCLITNHVLAQVSEDVAVQLSATVNKSDPSITLKWKAYPSASYYSIYKKTKSAKTWGKVKLNITSSAGTSTGWKDTEVVVGQNYEYHVYRVSGSGQPAYGYILAGIETSPIEYKGTMILLVDSAMASSLGSEISRLEWDIRGDGWGVIKHEIPATASVKDIKKIIIADYNQDKKRVRSVFLLGHIAIPYSGDLNPDGHTDHLGAWPADVFYGDMDGTWTDNTVNNTSASRNENKNVPGDGKFDQTVIPSNVELEVGRVDFFDMPAFGTEVNLLKAYLNKDHEYRIGKIKAVNKAVMDDNFGFFGGEAFAGSGYKFFSTVVGDSNIYKQEYDDSSRNENVLLGYGCGGGWYQGAGGIGDSYDMSDDSLRIVFSMLFGSYFGDWAATNNFLRAPLANKGITLTNVWSGRPHWQLHHMSLGENIGYDTRLTQNNTGVYYYSYAGNAVHIALMGDPSLKLFYMNQPTNLKVIPRQIDTSVSLIWKSAKETGVTYRIYRAPSLNDSFKFIGTASDTTFIDNNPPNGKSIYCLRPVKLQLTASGSYYNLGTGIFDSTTILSVGIEGENKIQRLITLSPNPSKDFVTIDLNEINLSRQCVLEIHDIQGKLIKSLTLKDNKTIVDCRNFPPGAYQFRIGPQSILFIKN